LNQLDLLGQRRVAETTERLLHNFLVPSWFQTELVLAHARMFFPDFTPPPATNDETAFADEIKNADQALQDYFCYVLLDFVAVDRELEEAPLAAALILCERLGLGKRFSQIAVRELGMTKKRFAQVERDAAKILERANLPTKAL
jgi:hypothetical protein